MSNADTRLECAWLATAAYSLMDQGLYEETADLFSPDAVWVRGGVPVAGQEAILSALRQRPATDLSRHIVTNVLVRDITADSARATAVFMPLRGPVNEDGTVPLNGINSVGDLEFEFSRQPNGWKISRLTPRMRFKA
ncbi:nuclear transport factor 2 family protein [Devosia nitrariae]|uniref:SnoaL-like domain-containing protein n=1 Tax=Devosia nitrariae TaxID=2071872 RepID=A0ABQ5W518_9HYPH|nr:nuclear transport factor 2 family protein [Devosia nitrariae]GLQ55175.1 hypothetical protein GCM10010862_24340 [Devosia nitrariae]